MKRSTFERVWAKFRFRALRGVEYILFAPRDEPERDTLKGVWLRFENGCLLMTVDPETDELLFSIHARRFRLPLDPDFLKSDYAVEDVSGKLPWRPFIGETPGFFWCCKDGAGYINGVEFAFTAIVPDVGIVAAASELKVYTMKQVFPVLSKGRKVRRYSSRYRKGK